MSKAGYAVLFALLLAGCETVGPSAPTPQAPPPPPPPPRMELGAIDGLGAFRTAGGPATCANRSVALMADNARSRARMISLYGTADHAMVPVALVRFRATKLGPSTDLVNSAQCGLDGRFAFAGLPPGGYFLITSVKVQGAAAGHDQFAVMQQVQLRVGETQQVRLSP